MARTKIGHSAIRQRLAKARRRRVLEPFRDAIVKVRNVNRLIGRGAPGTGGPREAAAAKLQLRANAADVAMRALLRAGDEEAIVQAFVDAKEAAHEAQAHAALREVHHKRTVERHRREAEELLQHVDRASIAATSYATEVTFRLRRFRRRATEYAERCRREVAGDEDGNDEADEDDTDESDDDGEDALLRESGEDYE